MIYRGPLLPLLWVLLLWMIVITCACGLILLGTLDRPPDPRPSRTRPPHVHPLHFL